MARDDDLQRWTDAGLITAEQRAAILEHERARATAPPSSKLPAAVEVLTYLGAAAVTAAIAALLSDVWQDLGLGGQFTLLALLSIGTGVGGWLLRDSSSAQLTRASSVLWLLSVWFIGSAFLAVGTDIEPDEAWHGFLLVGIPSLALAIPYQRLQPRAPQVFALYLAAVQVALGLADLIIPELTLTGGGLTVALVGVGGAWLTRAEQLAPRGVSYALAGVLVVGGTYVVGWQGGAGWAEALSVLTSVALLAASVPFRSSHMLIVGGLGLFLTVTTSVMRHFADTVGVPVALLVVGAMLIGSAIVVTRLRPMTRAEP